MPRVLILVLGLLLSLASLGSTSPIDCLECWETLCNPDVGFSPKCTCDCVRYVPGGDMCTEFTKIVPDTSTCCTEADKYIENEIDPFFTPVSTISGECSLHYNQPEDRNIVQSSHTLLQTEHLFVIDAIEFECEGCIQSVSFYLNQSTNPADFTAFTLSVWRPHINTSALSNSVVFVATDSKPFSFDSQPVIWNNIYRAESTVNGMLCFEPGDRLGVTIPKSFTGKILMPQSSDVVTYMQSISVCPMLNEILFPQLALMSEVPLIDVTIVNSDMPTTPSSSSNFPSTSDHSIVTYSSTMTTMAPLITTLSTSNAVMNTSIPPSTTSSSTLIFVGIAVGILFLIVALVCGGISMLACILRKHQVGHADVKYARRAEMSPGETQVRPGESHGSFNFAEDWHQGSPALVRETSCNTLDNNGWDGQTESIHHYDDPNELNTVPRRSSQFSINEHQYTCMEIPDSGAASNATSPSQTLTSPSFSTSHAGNRPPSRNGHYQSPRTPASSSLSSDYDSRSPAVLDKFATSRQISSITPDHPLSHVYQRLEDPMETAEQSPPIPPRSSSISKHDYHVLEEPGKEHHYHVMEKGYHVPGASDRLSWLHQNMQVPNAVIYPQLFHQYQTMCFFDEKDHYWEPAEKPSHIYDQLKINRCREIPENCLEFKDEIGSGHFGVVYKGVWKVSEEDQKVVAIKTLKPQAANKEQKSRLLREGARMMQFFHSNVVMLHGMVTMSDVPMLVIEYMTNQDLLSFLQQAKKKKNIPEPQILLRFCRDIAAGMRHLSKKKFIHRDLAARNILLNESLVCKISDFGMTRDETYRYKMDTAEHIPLRWTPLEAVNERKYSEKSDVYSYGMVMFEIWSLGQKPLTTMSDRDTIMNFIQQGGVCFPPPGCPREIYRLMIRCWHPNPIKRPSFADIIEDFLSTSDESLLHWSTQDKRSSPKAFEIGANIKEGFNLYVDLQKIYREQ